MRFGFIGCGSIATLHMNNLSRMEGVELVAFCDVDEGRAKEAARRFKGRAYTDHRIMLEKEPLDAIYICIPPYAHTDQEIAAAQAGVALFVEKPVALSLEKALEVRDAIKKAGVINAVGYQFRYFDGTDLLKERLQGKRIGMVMGQWMGTMPGTLWWRRKEMSGGQIVEQTTHLFDLSRYLVGEIVSVSTAAASRVLHQEFTDFNITDVGTINLWFADGTIGCITNTCLLRASYGIRLTLFTRDLIAEFSPTAVKFIEPHRTEEVRHQRQGHIYESLVFVEAVRTKNQALIRSDYADATQTLAVTLAAIESAEKGGEPIKVPRHTHDPP